MKKIKITFVFQYEYFCFFRQRLYNSLTRIWTGFMIVSDIKKDYMIVCFDLFKWFPIFFET